jgi:hypothetical protein
MKVDDCSALLLIGSRAARAIGVNFVKRAGGGDNAAVKRRFAFRATIVLRDDLTFLERTPAFQGEFSRNVLEVWRRS